MRLSANERDGWHLTVEVEVEVEVEVRETGQAENRCSFTALGKDEISFVYSLAG